VSVRPQVLWFILMLFLLAAQACAVAAQKEAFSGSSSRTAPGSDVTGLWEGTAVNGCGFVQMDRTRCHAVVNIALTMTQQGSTVGGSYKCSTGTMMCRKLNDTGEIAYGAVREGGLSLRVMLPDGSSCILQSKRSAERMGENLFVCRVQRLWNEGSGRWSGSTSVSESARASDISPILLQKSTTCR
jgi:hypothetical protein